PTVTSDAAERIRIIEQRLMARDNLLSIAREFNLNFEGNQSPTAMVEAMRTAIRINQIDAIGAANRGRVVGFTVKFQYRDGSTASRVTNQLVNSILSQNVETRLNRASETSNFFGEQRRALEQR